MYPYTQLHLGKTRSVAVAGPHFFVLESETGKLEGSTTNFDEQNTQELLKSGPIHFSAVDAELEHLVTVGEDKKLKVWELNGPKLRSQRDLPKRPTSLSLTKNGRTILVSDKFGDVFSYPLHPDLSAEGPAPAKRSRDSLSAHENPSRGTLVLGHVSLLTDFVLTPDERYIISADRDEHIRVSWYPQGYNIEMFCLGHRKFVSALHIPAFDHSLLVSGGGDSVLKVWDWMTGKERHDIPIQEAVEPFIVVKGKKRRWFEEGEMGDENSTVRVHKKGRKGKGKGKATEAPEQDATMGEAGDDGSSAPAIAVESTPVGGPQESIRPEVEELVLAVHKIDSFETPRGKHLAFSAVGCTSLFACDFPSQGDTSSPAIQAYNFQKPVIDFHVYRSLFWVLVDDGWGDEEVKSNPVQCVKWSDESQEFIAINPEEAPPLLCDLNTRHRVSASPEECKSLDLYANLSWLPKNVDPTRNPMNDDILAKTEFATPEELSIRQQGRLKHKKALLAKLQKGESGPGSPGNSATPGKEPEQKKIKQDHGADGDEMDDA
ncbi:WD40 repeat-like protein [Thelephora terrestris]|uniref:WD40 repeat-like protein n=1 Tax=Thelephora terrestris TaxID=56493 RepID=A0A9P6LAV1_9AGAM|nr:WD40 repeat-like protein [Thelephora terrestris]